MAVVVNWLLMKNSRLLLAWYTCCSRGHWWASMGSDYVSLVNNYAHLSKEKDPMRWLKRNLQLCLLLYNLYIFTSLGKPSLAMINTQAEYSWQHHWVWFWGECVPMCGPAAATPLALTHYFLSGQQARRNSWGQVVGSHLWSIRRSVRGAS